MIIDAITMQATTACASSPLGHPGHGDFSFRLPDLIHRRNQATIGQSVEGDSCMKIEMSNRIRWLVDMGKFSSKPDEDGSTRWDVLPFVDFLHDA